MPAWFIAFNSTAVVSSTTTLDHSMSPSLVCACRVSRTTSPMRGFVTSTGMTRSVRRRRCPTLSACLKSVRASEVAILMSPHSFSLDTAPMTVGVILPASACGLGGSHPDVQSSSSSIVVVVVLCNGACRSGGRFAHGSRVSSRHGGCSWLNLRTLYAGSVFAVS